MMTAAAVFADGKPLDVDFSAHTPANAALRSMVLPGWGQCFNGQTTKGYIVTSGFVVTAAASYLFYTQANQTYDDYGRIGVRNGSLYSDYEAQSNQAMLASLVAAGVWVYGMADAYIVSNKTQKNNPYAGHNDGVQLVSRGGDWSVLYRKRF